MANLRLVLSLDEQTQTYDAVAHNLTVEQAVEHVEKPQAEGVTAALAIQERNHRSLNIAHCKPCKRAAAELPKRLNQALTNAT